MTATATLTVAEDELNSERDLDQIASELGSLAATLAATTCQFLLLLAEFDRRAGWQAQGIASTSQWLSWRCGMSGSTAREQVRVARRLVDLPQTVERFAAGQLSYSKVRAITRVATAETEAELLEIAESATANQLDRFVAGVGTATSVDTINERHSARYLTFRFEDDGSVSFSGRCSPEDGAAILERLRLIQDYLERTESACSETLGAEHTTDEPPLPGEGPRTGAGRNLLDALVLLCDEAAVGAAEDPTAADEAIGSRRSETVLHVTLDELTEAAASGLSASAEAAPSQPEVRIGPRLEMGPALHPSTARRLCCDTGLVLNTHEASSPKVRIVPNARPGRTLNMGRRRRLASRALMRALWVRDHGCRFPGCERRRYLHAHHIRHWADGGPTDLDNLVLLCGQHHRLLHEGEYRLELRGSVVTVYDPAGDPLPAVPPLPLVDPGRSILTSADDEALVDGRLPLDPLHGGSLDLKYAVGVVAERWQLQGVS